MDPAIPASFNVLPIETPSIGFNTELDDEYSSLTDMIPIYRDNLSVMICYLIDLTP